MYTSYVHSMTYTILRFIFVQKFFWDKTFRVKLFLHDLSVECCIRVV